MKVDNFEDARMMFAYNLQQLRKENNITQKDVAHKLAISESTYANWEQGRREPCIFFIMQLAEIFGCDINTLFENDLNKTI